MNSNSENIYLIGMMGAGKSTVGKNLAERIGKPFVDLDSEIEKRSGKTVSEIFKREGEGHFRRLESKALAAISGSVVACGGGIVIRRENRDFMHNNGKVILLKASVEELKKRVGGSSQRPLLNNRSDEETLSALWRERRRFYEEAAHATVNTDHRTAEEVTLEVLDSIYS